MMILCALLLLLLIQRDTYAQSITPLESKTFISEGENVTLSCKYEGAVTNLHWYRQYPRSKPEFLVFIYPQGATSKPLPHRLLPKVDKGNSLVHLEIFPAEVTDSALYYCAMTQGNRKIIFGKGTQLTVISKKEVKPSIYKVGDSCLATDFTKHYAVNDTDPFNKKNITAVRYEGQNYYSSFAFDGNNCPEEGGCEAGSSDQTGEIEKDEKINFLSLGIFWLRILFLKTVVFNVLMTVKAWMS